MTTPKLRMILLIDDSEPDNFIHREVIERFDCAEQTRAVESGEEALEFLRRATSGPDLIFLDINMPGMSGWDFLDEYMNLPENQLAGVVIVMLTTSASPRDQARAEQHGALAGFVTKPLEKDILNGILEEHFPHFS